MDVTRYLTENADVKAMILTPEQLNIAASLLYVAYRDDPIFKEIFYADKPNYDKRLRSAIREELGAFWQTKQPIIGLFSGEHLLGVACLIQPTSKLEPHRFWHWRLKMMLSVGVLSTNSLIDKEKEIAAAIPYDTYHLLTFIAVHPDHQHHGLGHYLIKAVSSMVKQDPNSEGVAVFVTAEKNKPLFSENNYKIIDQIEVGEVFGTLMFLKTKQDQQS